MYKYITNLCKTIINMIPTSGISTEFKEKNIILYKLNLIYIQNGFGFKSFE